jgi:hypothetical protein
VKLIPCLVIVTVMGTAELFADLTDQILVISCKNFPYN